tara:strand:- start:967 stop:4635 length:3669 start_codon:yes stop_codon:yes gene_type:complete
VSFAGSDRFRLIEMLGRGAFGAVYRVEDRERGTEVALKTLYEVEPQSLLLFKNEFRALQDLDHPNLVHFHELYEEAGEWYFTMDLVDGQGFREYVRPGGVLDNQRLARSVRELASALAHVHSAGLVHRDLKPSNVRIDAEGRAVLLDFGLVIGSRQAQDAIVGTPLYMAPEQAQQAPVGPPADLYALGVMLFEAWSGEPPFVGSSLHLLMRKQVAPAPSLRAVDPHAPDALVDLCDRLLDRSPALRPSAEAIARALETAPLGAAPVVEVRKALTPMGTGSDPEADTMDALPSAPSSEDDSGRTRAAVEQVLGEATPEAPFVGRESELEILERALRESREGALRAVFVEGESGVGKTALKDAFVARVEERGGTVLGGRCYEHERVPYKAFDGIVDALARDLARRHDDQVSRLLPAGGALLAQVFPVLGRVTAKARDSVGVIPRDGLELRDLCFRMLADLLDALAQEEPVVLTVDDFQWADADSLRLFEVLAERASLLVVATLREPTAEVIALADAWTRLPLERLNRRDAEALARVQAPEGVDVSALAEQANGHPLLIAELARHAQGRRGPVSIRGVIRERLDALAPEQRNLVIGAALAVRPITPLLGADVAGLPRKRLSRSLKALRLANLLRTAPGGDERRIECFHDHVRATVVEGLGEPEAREWHARLAQAFEGRQRDEDVEALAFHWRAAGDIQRAAEHALVAARGAVGTLAFSRAADFYLQALEAERPWSEARGLHVELAEALRQAGRGAEAGAHFVTATRDAEPRERQRLLAKATQTYLQSGQLDEGIALADEVLAEVGMTLPKGPKRALASMLWHRSRLALRGLGFEERGAEAVDPMELEMVDTVSTVGTALAMADFIRGADFQSRALRMALDCGEPGRVARALSGEGAAMATGEAPPMKKARALLERAESIAEGSDDPELRAWLDLSWGTAYLNQFDFVPALEHAQRADDVLRAECTGVPWELSTTHTLVVMSLWSMGRYAELARLAPQYVREARERSDVYGSTTIVCSGAYATAIAADEVAEGIDRVRRAMAEWGQEPFKLQHFLEMEAMTELEIYAGGSAALERHERWWGALKSSLILTMRSAKFVMLACRARAALAAGRDRGGDRGSLVEAAARDLRKARPLVKSVCCQAQLDQIEGAVRAARGDVDGAVAMLERAEEGLRASAMEGYADAAALRRADLRRDFDALDAAADALRAKGVVNPRRYAWLRAPGPWD